MSLLRCAVAAALVAALNVPLVSGQPGSARYRDVVFAEVVVSGPIPYRQAVNVTGALETLTLDLYQPAADTEARRPAIIWIHGGGFRPGNDKRQKYIVAVATEFAKRGFVSVAPDYRVRAEVGPDRMPALKDALEDCRAALGWVRAHAAEYRIDSSRIALGGGSAGGMIAVNLAATEGRASGGTTGVFALVDLWGSPPPSLRVAEIGPAFPPTVIVHGTADELVPFSQSEQLAAELKAHGVAHELRAIAGAPHTPTAAMPEILRWTSAFVYGALTGK
jgi:acetyl esterase/lipase